MSAPKGYGLVPARYWRIRQISFAIIALACLGSTGAAAQATLEGLSFTIGTNQNTKLDRQLQNLAEQFNNPGPAEVAPIGEIQFTNSGASLIEDRVVIDATADSDPVALAQQLTAIGATAVAIAGFVVSAQVPVAALSQLEQLDQLHSAAASSAITRSGLVVSQGDSAMRADLARSLTQNDGTGVTIGVLSDSFDCFGQAADDIANGDLPADVDVLMDFCPLNDDGTTNSSDEGRAMMQLITDVAPGAAQRFHTAFGGGTANFVKGIGDLAEAGADVIVDDVLILTEPWFQDGVVAQKVNEVVEAGRDPAGVLPDEVLYFSAAGNTSSVFTYEADFQEGGPGIPIDGNSEVIAHDFDPGPGVDLVQRINFPAGPTARLWIQWDEPHRSASGPPGSAVDVDVFLLNEDLSQIIAGSTISSLGGNAFEVISGSHNLPFSTFNLVIQYKKSGNPPGRLKYIDFNSVISPLEYATGGDMVVGQANAENAVAVGAAFFAQTPVAGVLPPLLEDFSSTGGLPIVLDTDGNRIPAQRRFKPELVGPDGTNTTFFGQQLPDGDNFPNFSGTSAAAPHVAAVAALMNGQPDIVKGLRETAVDMDVQGDDELTGTGFVDALSAVQYRELTLSEGEWVMISLPAVAPTNANTVADIFDAEQLGVYDQDWVLYEWDPTVVPAVTDPPTPPGGYFKLSLTSTLETGRGYWIIQQNQPQVIVSMPEGSTQPVSSKTGCPDAVFGCTPLVIDSSGPSIWNLVGNPFHQSGPAIMDFMVTTSAEGPCEGICTFLMASDQTGANVVFDSFFAWNPAADDYDKLEPGDRFNSWQGYWYPLLPEGIGNEAQVYIPR